MVGDLGDMAARLRAVLPKRWFSDTASNLAGLLAGLGTPFAWLYTLITYVTAQSRLATATDIWLDMTAMDFLGQQLPRRTGEPDESYRRRIQQAILQEAVTRPALVSAMTSLTGNAPYVFEPSRCMDTGTYGASMGSTPATLPMSYNQSGGWGSLQMPCQFFVTVNRPATAGVANLNGYGYPAGAYGLGSIAYVDLEGLPGAVSDMEIQTGISRLLPTNATAWLRII